MAMDFKNGNNLDKHHTLKFDSSLISYFYIWMHFMIDEAKRMKCHEDHPDEDQLQSMYEIIRNSIFKFSNNPKCENFLWSSTHAKHLIFFCENSLKYKLKSIAFLIKIKF